MNENPYQTRKKHGFKDINVANHLYQNDLPADLDLGSVVAVDCETMGLHHHRDRLCLVQMSGGDGHSHIIQITKDQNEAPNLTSLLANPNILKLFHFGRFDIAALYSRFETLTKPVYCTKIASRIARTNSNIHGLKYLCKELLGKDISKSQQSSDWGAEQLSTAQLEYAASDVLFLHQIQSVLDQRLEREGRGSLARACFDFLPTRALLDVAGWSDVDIFAHK